MLPIAPIILLVRLIASAAGGTSGGTTSSTINRRFSGTGRAALWVMAVIGWAAFMLVTVMFLASDFLPRPSLSNTETLAFFLAVDSLGTAALFFPWPILRALARRGRPKLVYYLAHLSLIFPSTGETYAGACLLAGIALAHRGDVTKKEIRWLESRLQREHRYLGTFGAAFALLEALKAKRARDKGRVKAAREHSERARTLFGTLTYMSPRAIPKGVLKFTFEYLALDDARNARWGPVLLAQKGDSTRVVRALAGWVRQQDGEEAKPWERRARAKLASPILEKLFARPKEGKPIESATEARALLGRDYDALVKGQPVSPRSALNVLSLLDTFLHPECPDTLLPEEIRGDNEAIGTIHDEVAFSLLDVFVRTGVPLFAMKNVGPISARVYQALESALLEEMQGAFDRVNEYKKIEHRRDPYAEWLEVAYVRGIYRRVEFTLGPDAASRVWRAFVYSYCNFGVLLSETWPRRRPLAFAIFRVLSMESHRFQDHEHAKQQLHNMTVTAGIH